MEDYNINFFGRNVLYILRRQGTPIGEFEKKIGIPNGFISRIAHSDSDRQISTFIKIANGLEMYLDDIFFYDTKADELQDMMDERERLEAQLQEIEERIKARQ